MCSELAAKSLFLPSEQHTGLRLMVPEVRETHIFGPGYAPPPSSQRKVAPGLGQKQWSLLTWDKAGLPGAT